MSRWVLVALFGLTSLGCGRSAAVEEEPPRLEPEPAALPVAAPLPADAGTEPTAACVPGPYFTAADPGCAELSRLAVSFPVLTDDGKDGALAPGEGAVLQVLLQDVAGGGFGWYPGVTFTSATPGVEVTGTDWLYALMPCQSTPMAARVSVDAAVPRGTTAVLVAQAALLHQACPNAPALRVSIPIR